MVIMALYVAALPIVGKRPLNPTLFSDILRANDQRFRGTP